MLDALPSLDERELFSKIRDEDPALADELLPRIFRYEDLIRLDDGALARLLASIDRNCLTLALRASGKELRERLLGLLPAEEGRDIRSDLDWAGAIPLEEIGKAMDRIRAIARRLAAG